MKIIPASKIPIIASIHVLLEDSIPIDEEKTEKDNTALLQRIPFSAIILGADLQQSENRSNQIKNHISFDMVTSHDVTFV